MKLRSDKNKFLQTCLDQVTDGLESNLNVITRVVAHLNTNTTIPSREVDHELDMLNYLVVFFHNRITRDQRDEYIGRIRMLLDSNSDYSQTLFVSTADEESCFKCLIDASLLLKHLFKLDDKRLVFSDDPRILLTTRFDLDGFELTSICRRLCIEPNRWEHDISFWTSGEFDYKDFLHTISRVCYGLVRVVKFIDEFDDLANRRRSFCFRLVYESCDRALDWDTTRSAQYRLRRELECHNHLIMR